MYGRRWPMTKFTEREMAKVIAGFILLIILPLSGMLWADMKAAVASKADAGIVKTLCDSVETKVDKSTLMEMIRRLDSKDFQQEKQLQRQQEVQDKTLEVLQELTIAVEVMNKSFE